MSEKTVKASDIELPFFARFLEEQSAEADDDTPPSPPQYPPYTIKFPSDWEDV